MGYIDSILPIKPMILDKNSLNSVISEKSEWLPPKISNMNMQATENGTRPFAAEQNYTEGASAGQPTNFFGGS